MPNASVAGTVEDVVRICRDFMGWVEWKPGMPHVPETGYYHLHRGDSVQVTGGSRLMVTFSPFDNASDDVEVLARAREIWLAPAKAWIDTLPRRGKWPNVLRQWDAFQRGLPAAWEYTAGDYSRCATAVLDTSFAEG